MLKNYLLTALRILWRQKTYSAINIFGLTLGIACSLLIIIYVADELSYDRFHPDAGKIYRIGFNGRLQDRDFSTAQTGIPMAEALMNEIPQVESVIRLTRWHTFPVRYEDKAFTEDKFMAADSNFFDFFHFRLIAGNPKEALRGPNKVVISETAAKKYFGYTGPGDTSPLGKMFVLGSSRLTAEVTGIAADAPHNSHFHFDFLWSLESWDGIRQTYWLNSAVYTYVKLKDGASVTAVDDKFNYFIKKYCAPELEKFLNLSLEHFLKQGGKLGFSTTPLLDIHLKSNTEDELEPNGSVQYLYLFGAIAFFIILLACINFMNLSTARSANRAKEVGVRKTIGALRQRMLAQFLLESCLYALLAVMAAIGLVSLSLGSFNTLSGKALSLSTLTSPIFIAGILGFTLMVGLMAGSYPAFYLTSFKPVEVLKGKVRAGMRSSGIRNFLVVFQFLISIALIISTLMVYKQLDFVQQKNLGFAKENVVNLLHTLNLEKNGEAFKNELLKHPEIVTASYANRLPPNIDWTSVFRPVGTEQDHLLSILVADYDYLKTLNLKMVKGRFFSHEFPSDSTAVIINETAARQMGMADFEGRKLFSHFNNEGGTAFNVIGIIQDFNFQSLHSAIAPLVIVLSPQPYLEMAIRLTPGNEQEKIKLIESLWKKFAPGAPFEYSFVDQNFDAKFRAEQRLGQLFVVFTSLAIVIACLGLLGLATFTAEQRAKELSIRKVMGASVTQVALLMSKDFARLVIIAFVVAVPLTWYGLNNWFLNKFAYHVEFDLMVVAISGLSAFLVSILTISFQAVKAALNNPVSALKSE